MLRIDKHKILHARQILADPIFDEIFLYIEQNAVNLAIGAPLTDHESRAAFLSEARAVRTLRQKLKLIAESETETGREGA